jgi:hypothetical protein
VKFGRAEAAERGGFFPYGGREHKTVLVLSINIRVECIRNPLISGLSGRGAVGKE